MQRIVTTARPDWQRIVESQGFLFHGTDDLPCWNEEAYYAFTSAEIDEIERATQALDAMCLEAVDHVVRKGGFEPFGVAAEYWPYLAESWEKDEHTVYGRFDLAHVPGGSPRLLEYNADTPTALLEAAVIQWFWLRDTQPEADQFNSIHERLIEAWQTFAPALPQPVTFTCLGEHMEDFVTVQYLRDTAMQAGLATQFLPIEQVRWHPGRGRFTDAGERDLGAVFKLYPWEWMFREAFGPHLPAAPTRWLEPPWKVLLSNKAILAVLWELFPESPYLLRAEFAPFAGDYVRKPRQGREGANVCIVRDGRVALETEGDYEGEAVYQQFIELPQFDGQHAVIGSWMVNGNACGIGVREDCSPVTQNTSRFVPHCIR